MKKRNFSLLLNIATICLCVCAIAIGVYSAKTASLTISGSIGFNAHNVKASVSLYVKGDSLDASNNPSAMGTHARSDYGTEPLNSTTINARGTGTSPSLAWDKTLYFYDLGTTGNPETIYFKLAITNTSDYPILAKVNLADSISATNNANLIIDSSKDNSAIILAKNGEDGANGSIEFAISIKPDSTGVYANISSATLSLQVDLTKTDLTVGTEVRANIPAEIKEFDDDYKKEVRNSLLSNVTDENILSYAERYPYYIEMGGVPSQEKVKWLIVGTMGESGLVALSDNGNDRKVLSKGLMNKDTTYVVLSEKALYPIDDNYNSNADGIVFQNSFYVDNMCAETGYTDIKGNDYAASSIRQYLLGKSVDCTCTIDYSCGYYRPDGNKVNLYDAYKLTSDPVFNKIKGRNLSSLYNENITLPSIFDGTTEDRLWLLSKTEVISLFGNDDKLDENYYSARVYKYNTTNYADGYMLSLRSANPTSGNVYSINSIGLLFDDNSLQSPALVRPAFLI